MSLRLRLVAAFAYVLVLVLAAIEIPFALSVSDRVNAEVRAHAENQAHLVAASASGRLSRREELQRLVERAGGDLGGRVLVVDARGRVVADAGTEPGWFTGDLDLEDTAAWRREFPLDEAVTVG